MSEPLRLIGTPEELYAALASPEAEQALAATEHIPGKMRPYQYALLHRLAGAFDGGRILEIGCYQGRSAVTMAMAAPRAWITTMSPDGAQVAEARRHRKGWKVEVLRAASWDVLEWDKSVWDMIYVDGDHVRVARDLPWFNRLRTGGLMLFHDYTAGGDSVRGHPYVCQAVDGMAERLGREPDVLVVDSNGVGMAGLYRREGESC